MDEFGRAAQLEPPKFNLLLDWALAYDCAGNADEAIAKFTQASVIQKDAHVYSQIGMEYGKMGKYPQALDALATAVKLDPDFAMTYFYLRQHPQRPGRQGREPRKSTGTRWRWIRRINRRATLWPAWAGRCCASASTPFI